MNIVKFSLSWSLFYPGETSNGAEDNVAAASLRPINTASAIGTMEAKPS